MSPRTLRSRRVRARRRVAGTLIAATALALTAAMVAPMLNEAVQEVRLPLRHDDIIRQQAADKRLDASLIAAVIYAESRFRDQTSPTGAKGLMQIQPDTARFIARKSGGTAFELRDLATPQINIAYGSWYLRYLLDRYGDDVTRAVAAYNGGETNVDRWVAAAERRGEDFGRDHIGFEETRAYVARVTEARSDYRRTYPRELGQRTAKPY